VHLLAGDVVHPTPKHDGRSLAHAAGHQGFRRALPQPAGTLYVRKSCCLQRATSVSAQAPPHDRVAVPRNPHLFNDGDPNQDISHHGSPGADDNLAQISMYTRTSSGPDTGLAEAERTDFEATKVPIEQKGCNVFRCVRDWAYSARTGRSRSVSLLNSALTEPFVSVPFGMPVRRAAFRGPGRGAVNHVGRYHSYLPRLRSGIYVHQRRAGFLCQPRLQ
jgi:hypothetical protein